MNYQLLDVVVHPSTLVLEWRDSNEKITADLEQLQRDIYRRYIHNTGDWLLALGFKAAQVESSKLDSSNITLNFWQDFARHFTSKFLRQVDLEKTREKTVIPLEQSFISELLLKAPLASGSEYLDANFLEVQWNSLNQCFAELIKNYDGSVEDFIHSYSPTLNLAGRVYFHLVESKKENLPFAFLATYSTQDLTSKDLKHIPLKHALQEYQANNEKLLALLATVYRASKESQFLAKLIETGEIFHPLAWSNKEAFTFLTEVPLYENSGVLCRIPNWWTNKSSTPQVSISIAKNEASFVGLDSILKCKPSLSVNGVEISFAEAQELLNATEGLALIKNKWIAVDQEKLKQALEVYKKAEKMYGKDGISFREAMQFQLNPEKVMGTALADIGLSITQDQWLEAVSNKLLNPKLVDKISPAKGFSANLRPYQQVGLNWLGLLDSLNLGACLADDMGLGKTIQILAFLSYKKSKKTNSLLVVPASLIANWLSEIKKFDQSLLYIIAHPQQLKEQGIEKITSEKLSSVDLVITTYAMSQRYEELKKHSWDYVILDEAQAIKNPGTKQTRIIKQYQAKNRIVMTGTPIENSLADLWSLFDFLNPGLLGNSSEFNSYVKKLKDNKTDAGQLRKIISPYILRRLKTDKTIIDDLPAKVELKSFAELTKEQTILYHKLLSDLEKTLKVTEGIKRKGLVLSTLLKFKQLCNHPDQFLGKFQYNETESGKFQRLREICQLISEKRERVLIFTQFKELTDPLSDFLTTVFGRKGLVLHGSVALKKRKEMVDIFQNKAIYTPFMVLSLKAGGVGLNLTEANHVIHFDRWWNPAVENQATDRAFRIGQEKKVMVHKFITLGTIEERIDLMLEDKAKLSSEMINTGAEVNLTELADSQLLDMFRLRF